CRRHAVDHVQHLVHAERRRHDLGQRGDIGQRERGREPARHAVARTQDDRDEAQGHQREAEGHDDPQHRQERPVGHGNGADEQRDARPLRDAQRNGPARLDEVVAEQGLVQRERGHAVQRDRQRAAQQHPLRRHDHAQPLGVPAGRQSGDAQVQEQPTREQHVQRLAVDERRDQDEQRQHDHAAVEQARLAVVPLDGQVELRLRPLHDVHARGAGEGAAAQDLARQVGQLQGEAGLGRMQIGRALLARRGAQRLQGGGVPAGNVDRVARREFDDVADDAAGRAGPRAEAEPHGRFGQVRVKVRYRNRCVEAGIGRGRGQRRCFLQDADVARVAAARHVLAVPAHEGHDGNDTDHDRNQIIGERLERQVKRGLRQARQFPATG
ncbi:conserved hypothetical protein, partial [Ricinus communis]